MWICHVCCHYAILTLHCSSCWTYWLWENCVVLRLIDNVREMIEPSPTRTCYSYGEFQSMFNNYPQVHFHEGLPCKHDLVVSDNLQKWPLSDNRITKQTVSRKIEFYLQKYQWTLIQPNVQISRLDRFFWASPFMFLVSSLFFFVWFPCGRLSWLHVSFWAHVNIVHHIIYQCLFQSITNRFCRQYCVSFEFLEVEV